MNSGWSRAHRDSVMRWRNERCRSATAIAGTSSVNGNGSSVSISAAADAVAAHSASIFGSRARALAVRCTTRCRASSPGLSTTSPRVRICATVWLAAEWVTEIAVARSRIGTGPSATSARTTGLKRGRKPVAPRSVSTVPISASIRSSTCRSCVPRPARESALVPGADSVMPHPALASSEPVGRRHDRGVERGAAAVARLLDHDEVAARPRGR